MGRGDVMLIAAAPLIIDTRLFVRLAASLGMTHNPSVLQCGRHRQCEDALLANTKT